VRIGLALLGLLPFVLLAAVEAAATNCGVVVGRVVDATDDSLLEFVTVAVVDAPLESSTRRGGRYVIPCIPVGEQRAKVALPGYDPRKEMFVVAPGETIHVDFRLQRAGCNVKPAARVVAARTSTSAVHGTTDAPSAAAAPAPPPFSVAWRRDTGG